MLIYSVRKNFFIFLKVFSQKVLIFELLCVIGLICKGIPLIKGPPAVRGEGSVFGAVILNWCFGRLWICDVLFISSGFLV